MNNCVLECESATFCQWWLLLTNTNLRISDMEPEWYHILRNTTPKTTSFGETTSGFGDGKLSVHLYEIQKPWFFRVNETTALPIPESNKPGGFRSISLSPQFKPSQQRANPRATVGNHRETMEKRIRDPSRIGAECFTTQSLMTWEPKTPTMITMGPIMWSSFMYIKIFKKLAMKIPRVLQYSISFYQSLYKQALDKNHPCMQGVTKNLQDVHPPKTNMTMEDHHL